MPSLRLYRFLQWLLRRGTLVFFRDIQVVGADELPADDAPVIFCGNHPNSLLDPILITAHCGRVVHFAAKDTLFAAPLLGPLMRALGAVPVQRRTDHPDGPLSNQAMFSALHKVLGEGRAVGIFPEGISHDDSDLAPLKTGAARIALGARRDFPDARIHVVPVGLIYFRRQRFRGSVLIQFGSPILAPAPGTDATDDAARVRALTDVIEDEMRALTINAPSWEQIWVLDGVRRLYRHERPEPGDASSNNENLATRIDDERRFNEIYPAIQDQPTVQRLYGRVRAYLRRLAALGLQDDVFRGELTPRRVFFTVADHMVLLLLDLPLFVIGAPLHLPIGLLVRLFGKTVSPRRDVIATTKFLLGFILVLMLYASVPVAVGISFGMWWGLLAAALLPLSGRAVVRVLGRAYALRNLFLNSARVLLLRREIAALRTERALLRRDVVAAVDHYRALADAGTLTRRAAPELDRASTPSEQDTDRTPPPPDR